MRFVRWFLPAWVFLAAALPLCAEEARVRPKQSLADLLGTKEAAARPGELPSPDRQGLLAKLGLWAAAVVGCGALFLLARRKRRKAFEAVPGYEGIEMISRLPLTHKHAVFVLKMSNRRFVVGVSADNISLLGEFDEAVEDLTLSEDASAAVSSSSSLSPAHGYSARPEDCDAVSSSRVLRDADLAPYRRQMDRLRGLLRGMRGGIDGEEFPGRTSSP